MPFALKWSSHVLNLDDRTHIMGILNITPDSFADGGRYIEREKAIEHGFHLARQGADIIDVGGESTRPYAEKVTAKKEIERVVPVIEALSQALDIPVSIDTYKAKVAREALRAGASMINDVSALRFDPDMIMVAAEAEVPVVIMHMKGTPADMQKNPTYHDLVPEIMDFLKKEMDRAIEGGIRKEMLIVDPGIGFGKTFDHNVQIINELSRFSELERPILLGSSRKAFIGHILDKDPDERDIGTMATVAAGILNGAHIVRVHNVEVAVDTAKVVDAIKKRKV